jgi:hypothetical protein
MLGAAALGLGLLGLSALPAAGARHTPVASSFQFDGVAPMSSAGDQLVVGSAFAGTAVAPISFLWNGTSLVQKTVPLPSTGAAELTGLTALPGTSEAFAAGTTSGGSVLTPYVVKWGGSSWTKSSLPSVGKGYAELTSVSGSGADDAWAAGAGCAVTTCNPETIFLYHWNGTSWSKASTSIGGYLTGVADVSPTDAWAVGQQSSGALVVRWNGTKWSKVSYPSGGPDAELEAVAAVPGTNQVLVVGSRSAGAFVSRWTGSAWVTTTLPGGPTTLLGVSADSSTDAWTVGAVEGVSGFATKTFHWNGTTWKSVASPNGSTNTILNRVAAEASNNAWAVGLTDQSCSTGSTGFVLHWTGSAWSKVHVPAASAAGAQARKDLQPRC